MLSSKKLFKDHLLVEMMANCHHQDLRLDNFLCKQFQTLSRQFLIKKIKKKEVWIENRTGIRPSTKVKSGNKILFKIPRNDQLKIYWKEKIDVQEPKILYDRDDILIVDKPPFYVTHPTGKHIFDTITVFFETYFQQKIYSVHRLDRETSGLLILSKSAEKARIITELFENSLIKKCYFFISHNTGNESNFTCQHQLDLNKQRFMTVYPKNSQIGKSATTDFKILRKTKTYGLAFPITGRQHQIRAHANAHKHPLIGDKIYGADENLFSRFKDEKCNEKDFENLINPRHALHAYALKLPKSLYPKEIITCPLPQDLLDLTGDDIKYIGPFLESAIDHLRNL